MDLHWTCSRMSMSLLYWRVQHLTLHSRCFTRAEWRGGAGSLSLTCLGCSSWCSPTISSIKHSFLFCFFCRFFEGVLWAIIQVINEDITQCWPQYWPLEYPDSNWTPAGLHAADYNSPNPAAQPVFSALHCLFTYPMLHQIVNEDGIRERIKNLFKVKINTSTAFSSSTETVISL